MNVLLSMLVIAGLLFGGGATVSAAQDDLPNEPLYGVKTWTEDLSLQLKNTDEAKVERLMELAQVRIQEMARLAEAGEPVQDRVKRRLEQHIQQALQICANMDGPTFERTLLQLRDHLRDQDRDMEQLQLRTQDKLMLQTQDQLRLQTQDQLQQQLQTRTMLQERLHLVEEGLLNHEIFRNAVQNRFQYGQDDELTPPDPHGNGEQNDQPNPNPGGPNTDPGSNTNDPGSNSGGDGSGGTNSNDNGSGTGGKP